MGREELETVRRRKNIVVVLTEADLDRVYSEAKRRYHESRRQGLKDRHGLKKCDRKKAEICGCLGELAYAIASAQVWRAPINEFKHFPDVGEAECRHTERGNGCLIIREQDRGDRPFVLIVGRPPRLRVVGWKLGRDCRLRRWRRAPNGRPPAWFVPQWALRPFPIEIEELQVEELEKREGRIL